MHGLALVHVCFLHRERYRDLISAADTIVEMKNTCEEVLYTLYSVYVCTYVSVVGHCILQHV